MRSLVLLIILLLVSESTAQPFLKEALGDLSDVPAAQRSWFTDTSGFTALSDPRGNSVHEYLTHWHNRPKGKRRTIVVRWLGPTDPRARSADIKDFLEAFFQLPVRIEVDADFVFPPLNRGKRSADKIRARLGRSLPEDAFVVIGLVQEDLYSEDNGPDRLLFGEGHYYDRTAVASLLRLRTENQSLYMHRVFKLLAHELVHTFSVEHCGYFACIMNPSGSIEGSDLRPLFLCPVCLRKQHALLHFSPQKRYEHLLRVLEPSLNSDSRWLRERLR